jgi:hypothetical protein
MVLLLALRNLCSSGIIYREPSYHYFVMNQLELVVVIAVHGSFLPPDIRRNC